jgi:Asp-tRNA(Asn)/Glu-tRNA(Gln) amidotransferase A subunit family amidase
MIAHEPWRWSLAESIDAIATGTITPLAVAESQLARIAATDAAIDAWATLDPALVRAQASRVPAPGAALGGIGVGVKDIIATCDMPTTMGSPIFESHRPAEDAACVARLREAGGFVFGKTTTTPFAFMDPSKTRNPWDPAHTPGGSSAGSAAAVAAGHVAAAIGTQTNGSVVRPAAYCGVVGFKPTLDVIPFAGAHVFSPTLDAVGTFTRNVADAARVASVLADAGCIAAIPPPLTRTPRLLYIGDFPWTQLDCHADAVVESAVTQLRMRTEVVPRDVPALWREANKLHRTIMLFEAAQALVPLQQRERARMTAALNAALDEGAAIARSAYDDAMAARASAIAFFTDWASGFDAILAPSAPGPAPWSLATTGDPSCCTLWSLLGFPALNLPVGFAERMPMGLQVAAPRGCDDRLLAVAAWCEARLPYRGLV